MAAQIEFGMQYWPIFLLAGGRHVGVCGLRPWRIEEKIPELGYHLRPEFWRPGFYPHPLGHPLDSLLGGLRDAERAYEKTTTGRPCSVDSCWPCGGDNGSECTGNLSVITLGSAAITEWAPNHAASWRVLPPTRKLPRFA